MSAVGSDSDIDHVDPQDSASNVAPRPSTYYPSNRDVDTDSITSSAVSALQKAAIAEIQLAGEAERLRNANALREEGRQLLRRLEEEAAKQDVEAKLSKMRDEVRNVERAAAQERLQKEVADQQERLRELEQEMNIASQLKVAQATTKALNEYTSKPNSVISKKSRSYMYNGSMDLFKSDVGSSIPVKRNLAEHVPVYEPLITKTIADSGHQNKVDPRHGLFGSPLKSSPGLHDQHTDNYQKTSGYINEQREIGFYGPLQAPPMHDHRDNFQKFNGYEQSMTSDQPSKTVGYFGTPLQAPPTRTAALYDQHAEQLDTPGNQKVKTNSRHGWHHQLQQAPPFAAAWNYHANNQHEQLHMTHDPEFKSDPGQGLNIPQLQSPPMAAAWNHHANNQPNSHEKVDMTHELLKQQAQLTKLLIQQQAKTELPHRSIPMFGGNPLEYAVFIRAFECGVEEKTTSDSDRMFFLEQYTSGEPNIMVKGMLHRRQGFQETKKMLEKKFGNRHVIAAEFDKKAEKWPTLNADDPKAWNALSAFLTAYYNTMEDLNHLKDIDNSATIKHLIHKLPYGVRNQWRMRVTKIEEDEDRMAGLKDFCKFIERHTKVVSNPVFGDISTSGERGRSNHQSKANVPSARRNVFATSVRGGTKDTNPEKQDKKFQAKPCQYCGGNTNHSIIDCNRFQKLTLKEKSNFCYQSKLCFGCLKRGHHKANCRNPCKCNVCQKKHPTVMHDDSYEKKPTQQQNQPKMTQQDTVTKALTGILGAGANNCTTGMGNPLMAIAPILVGTASQKVSTYAFMDNGCGAVFIEQQLKDALKLRSRPTKMVLKTINLQQVIKTQVITDKLQVSNIEGCGNGIEIQQVFVREELPVSMDDVPKQHDIDQWDHLRHIKLPRLTKNCIPRVTMIIGSNVPAATMPLQIISGKIGDPYAVETPLGMLIYGLPGKFTDQPETSVNFCRIDNAQVQTGLDHIQQQIQACINMDFSEQVRDSKPELSVNDKKFIQMMDDSVNQRASDGHYETMLPFKDRTTTVPNNKPQAQSYANKLGHRLDKQPKLHTQYNEFMTKLENKGYCERIPEAELQGSSRVWYLPHHPVVNPHKPDKIRVVFNCPLMYQETSLNRQLYQGPDLTNNLIGVLLRWRKERVAVTADIEQMFYQVGVRKEDCDMLRFLWWPKGDLAGRVEEYRMLVHPFGAVSSPSCAAYVLRKIAQECGGSNPTVSNIIKRAFYVDDMLKSFPSVDEALEVCKDTKDVLADGGFNLTKWVSNSRAVIQSVPEQDRAKEVKNLDLQQDNLPEERVLGIQWDVEDDKLSFACNEVERKPTRRNILSIMSSLYDPLGMVAPYALKAKLILQELCRKKIDWDELAPPEQQHEWESWTKDLGKLKDLKVDRCIKPDEFTSPMKTELHHFADASTKEYGVVSYIRYIKDQNIHCAFIMGKSRVCPLKKVTIPRLELTAARVAVRVDIQLHRELKEADETIESHFWTDSQTVLKYLNSETARFHTFVANRVEEIQQASHPSRWHYVATDTNPADDCSRGLTMDQLLDSSRWFKGPKFLWSKESEWPQQPNLTPNVFSSEDPDVRKTEVTTTEPCIQAGATVIKADGDQDPVTQIMNYYSSWTKLKRAVAWWIRFKGVLLRKVRDQEKPEEWSKYLTVNELQRAEETIIGYVQHQAFPDEIKALQSQQKIKSSSHIVSLDPMMTDGLLRVGGRLQNANISRDAKHQLILPKEHHVSDLILHHIHIQCNHQGQNQMLATLRQKYWILRGTQRVKQLVNRCVVCRRQRSKLMTQKMADLPANRLTPDAPPFSSVGMDYFGPFETKQGRVTRKRYGVIFTCMTTRAVHLEVANSLDTSSCINAIRRFTARRGQVKEITSDNGTNLVGANQELKKSIQQLDEETIQKFTSGKEIQWNFNPPGASHHGGVWERLIREVRKIMNSILNEQHLKTSQTDEGLNTLFCEIEAVLNNRPLTRVSNDPEDLNVITPNDLLLLKSTATLPPGTFDQKDLYSKRRWRQIQYLTDLFWKRWLTEYLPTLQTRQKWYHPERNLEEGDIVLVIDNSAPRNSWPMGKVEKVNIGNQGLVRSAIVKTKSSRLTRPISKLCLLLEQDS